MAKHVEPHCLRQTLPRAEIMQRGMCNNTYNTQSLASKDLRPNPRTQRLRSKTAVIPVGRHKCHTTHASHCQSAHCNFIRAHGHDRAHTRAHVSTQMRTHLHHAHPTYGIDASVRYFLWMGTHNVAQNNARSEPGNRWLCLFGADAGALRRWIPLEQFRNA